MTASTPRLATRLAYGVGQAAEGIKVAALGGLVFFYYHQVLGLSSIATACALFLGIVGDTFSDVLAGSISDRLRHHRGQRHPLMLAAALPTCVALVALFCIGPGHLEGISLFSWLAAWLLVCRISMSFFRVPHFALGADMGDSARARTTNVAFRQFFHVAGAMLVFWVAQLLMVPTPDFPVAQANPDYYSKFSIICASTALVVMLIATFGTWHTASPAPISRQTTGPRMAALVDAIHHTLRPRSFRILMYCVGAFGIAAGVQRATEIYVASYFWQLATQNVLLLPVATLTGALAGTIFWNQISQLIPMRTCYVVGVSSYALLAIGLPVAHLLQLFPPKQADAFVAIVLGSAVLGGLLSAAPSVFVGSMIADIIDNDERQTGRRRAASFFGTAAVVAKPALGVATLLTGALIAAAGIDVDQHASREISPSLGLAVGATVAVFALAAAFLMYKYGPDFPHELAAQPYDSESYALQSSPNQSGEIATS